MKKVFQCLGLFLIMLFSFYYTNRAAILARDSNPIMKNINEVKDELEVFSIDAIIENEYIIPGLNGLRVNTTASFNKMRPYHIFNEYYMVYDQVPPKISLEENKDKVIISGNKSKKEVALIISYDERKLDYFKEKGVKVSVLTTLDTYENTFERINAENEKFKELDKKLNQDKVNKKICVVNSNVNLEECKKNKYYLVEAKELTNNNLIEIKNSIENGSIILVNKNVDKEKLNVIVNYIKGKGLKLVYLSELIDETNSK